jgi:3-keto-5-aminohexanoate cleavage enzyme
LDKVIVNVALAGLVHSKVQNPALPVTPEEVAADARRCVDAGASILHIHARDAGGNPSCSYGHWASLMAAVRAAVPAAILCCSTSGRIFCSLDDRMNALLVPGFNMASLSTGSYNVGHDASVTDPDTVALLHKAIVDRGMVPEIEAFEPGHLYAAQTMKGWRNIFLGASLPAEVGWLVRMVEIAGPLWAGAGFGRHQFTVNKWALVLGGHVRTGLEDNLWMEQGVLATNPALVERIVAVAKALGREPASCSEARLEIFGRDEK